MPRVDLQADRLVMTADLMAERIDARFPGRGISRVAEDVRHATGEAVSLARDIQRPNRYLRGVSIALVILMVAIVGKLLYHLRFTPATAWEMLEGIDAGVSTAVYLGAAVLFLLSLDNRIKRRKALDAIKELRALAHVIDMHQLGKDPEHVVMGDPDEGAEDQLPPAQLAKYLDYCSDLLALLGKTAALYAQETQDGVVLGAVDEIEHLTTALSSKIWQKIVLLDHKLETAELLSRPALNPKRDTARAD